MTMTPDDPAHKPRSTRKTRRLNGEIITVNDNDGVRKRCGCARGKWASCPHSWHFSFMWLGTPYRFPVDKQHGHHVVERKKAQHLADGWRREIREGTFVSYQARRNATPPPQPTTPTDLPFEAFAEKWRTTARVSPYVSTAQQANDRGIVKGLSALELAPGERLGELPIGLLTVDRWEAAFDALATRELAGSSSNKYRQAILTMQEWGVDKGYLPKPWLEGKILKRRGKAARKKADQRDRRLVPDVLNNAGKVIEPGEESRLLAAANPWLQRLIIAALETGCRRGELLSLQWRDVSLSRLVLTIRAENTKTDTRRQVPISDKLLGVLQHIQHDPEGNPHPPSAFVFGNTLGERVIGPKKSWETCVLKAYGHQPEWHEGKLSAASRAHLRDINLHFHDLRREAGSRMLERGWPLHHVRDILGHQDIKTTSIYLSTTTLDLQDSMRRFGTGPVSPDSGESLHKLAQAPQSDLPPVSNTEPLTSQKLTVN